MINLKHDNLNLKGIMDDKYKLDLKELVEFSKSLTYISNYEKMASILDYSFNKDYYNYSKTIYNICSDKFTNDKIFLNEQVQFINLFRKMLFIVQDKEALLKNLKDKGYDVNQGPQSWRGQVNSISSFLNYLDTDYRKSLYNHSILHDYRDNLDYNLKNEILTKEHFTFRNIHQNLGNIKW